MSERGRGMSCRIECIESMLNFLFGIRKIFIYDLLIKHQVYFLPEKSVLCL